MAAKTNKAIDWLNHFVGLISVLLGVLIAFGLNNWNESQKEERVINTVLKNIANEIEENLGRLDSVNYENQLAHDQLKQYLRLVDGKMDTNRPLDSIRAFQMKNPGFISEDLQSISFSLELYQLSNVAWRTAERTNVLPSMDYDLVQGLAVIYDFQSKLERFDTDITDKMAAISSSENRKEDWSRIRKDLDIA